MPKTVAILGGGPAGSHTAERLARAGVRTILLDEKLAWEKPCGGGLTYKAYEKYPYIVNNHTPKREIHDAYLSAPRAGRVALSMPRPMMIYARTDLNQLLLDRAEAAGVSIEQTRVLGAERTSSGWRIRTAKGHLEADYCVLATGARNPLRHLGTEYVAADTMYALGYFVPGNRDAVDIQFLEGLEGYIWVFPRCGHLSVGICGKGEPASALRVRLESYMREHGLMQEGAKFYGHMLPALESAGWRKNRVAGEGWLAVGDAGGLVDPITGEGLYYALRSSDLASQTILAAAPESRASHYRQALSADFMDDLAFGASLARRVFLRRFPVVGGAPDAMVRLIRRSQKFQHLMQDLFAGTQPYLDLKKRLTRNLSGGLQEVLLNLFLNRMMPETE
ncbi:MAG: NAD(P)/FAD-dependent oxidoreductase [Bryobacteraceae bacterium]|nr:NAD(P)/FAD-dependent oxidoreductase [Bryobacteraceae bacterium]